MTPRTSSDSPSQVRKRHEKRREEEKRRRKEKGRRGNEGRKGEVRRESGKIWGIAEEKLDLKFKVVSSNARYAT